jgi:hypothetical protein
MHPTLVPHHSPQMDPGSRTVTPRSIEKPCGDKYALRRQKILELELEQQLEDNKAIKAIMVCAR